MKRKMAFCYIIILLIYAGSACNNKKDIVGGRCEYKEIKGTAAITSIVKADSGDNNSQVTVFFDFVPDDPDAVNNYRFHNVPDKDQELRVGGGVNPAKSYMDLKGITAGSSYKCKRMEITKGTCTPVIFDFYEIDFSDYGKYCR